MTPSGILEAFGTRLLAMSGVPAVVNWPNEDEGTTKPYLQVVHVPVSRLDDTIDAIGAIELGQFTVNVVVEAGRYSTQADDLASAILDHFPKGLRLTQAGDGVLLIYRPAELGSPFRDNLGGWIQPVRVHYQTEAL